MLWKVVNLFNKLQRQHLNGSFTDDFPSCLWITVHFQAFVGILRKKIECWPFLKVLNTVFHSAFNLAVPETTVFAVSKPQFLSYLQPQNASATTA